MPCYHPITAWRSRAGPRDGKWQLVFNRREGYEDKELSIPCGRCIGCRLERSRQWAIRMVHEASMHEHNHFVTLTYDPDHLPSGGTLVLRDLQLFFKRLRRYYGNGIRYFACGEYGDNTHRPHYHVCVFGLDICDRQVLTIRHGYTYYTSDIVSSIWGNGNILITDLTFETAAYTGRYCTKKITGEMAQDHYKGRKPEFCTMSRRSGIGKEWYNRYKSDIYVGDMCIVRDDLRVRPAKYYDKLFDVDDPVTMRRIKNARLKHAQKVQKLGEMSAPRLAIKERLKLLQAKKLKRSYEDATTTV